MEVKQILEAFEMVFELMKMAFNFLFTPPVLYMSILVFGPGIIAGIIGLIKMIFRRR